MNLALPSLNFKMYNPSGKDNTSIRTLCSSSQVTDKFAYDLPVALIYQDRALLHTLGDHTRCRWVGYRL